MVTAGRNGRPKDDGMGASVGIQEACVMVLRLWCSA